MTGLINANETSPKLQHPGRLFIGGRWVEPNTAATFDVVNPEKTEEVGRFFFLFFFEEDFCVGLWFPPRSWIDDVEGGRRVRLHPASADEQPAGVLQLR
ncbi:hypothetical protein GS434_20860 [Rhodococcus hoagii]|nr:hypothetical protein [Prescottella equi]